MSCRSLKHVTDSSSDCEIINADCRRRLLTSDLKHQSSAYTVLHDDGDDDDDDVQVFLRTCGEDDAADDDVTGLPAMTA